VDVNFWEYLWEATSGHYKCLVKRNTSYSEWQSGVKFVCTYQYTKTTDTAGSGTWTPEGVPAHHYSTSEQVIGTWIDGKPLYEKVFDGLSVSLNGVNWVYYNDINFIDNIADLKAYTNNSGRYLRCAISEYQRSDTNGVMLSGFNNFNRTINRMVLQYTKTTD
jgi:hypothetical protein